MRKKAKAAKKGGAKGKQDEAALEEEAHKSVPVTAQSEDGGDYNLNDPTDFGKAISRECPRPFTFGPIEFDQLSQA